MYVGLALFVNKKNAWPWNIFYLQIVDEYPVSHKGVPISLSKDFFKRSVADLLRVTAILCLW